jgi:hypothetical protein
VGEGEREGEREGGRERERDRRILCEISGFLFGVGKDSKFKIFCRVMPCVSTWHNMPDFLHFLEGWSVRLKQSASTGPSSVKGAQKIKIRLPFTALRKKNLSIHFSECCNIKIAGRRAMIKLSVSWQSRFFLLRRERERERESDR